MKRLSIATKGCVQLASNDTYVYEIWFSSIKMAEEMVVAGVDCCGPVKTIHKGFLSIHVRKVDEIFARKVISYLEDYSNIAC